MEPGARPGGGTSAGGVTRLRWGVVEIPPGAQKHLDSTVDDMNPALKDPKLWELWYSPYYGSCRI